MFVGFLFNTLVATTLFSFMTSIQEEEFIIVSYVNSVNGTSWFILSGKLCMGLESRQIYMYVRDVLEPKNVCFIF